MEKFNKIENLPSELTRILEQIGFTNMTQVQAESIPVALEGRDILGSAQTGTGKTGAFIIPIIAKLIKTNDTALILTPTRELAIQVSEFVRKLCIDDIKIRSALLIGGDSIQFQMMQLKKNPRIIIGTPGRVIDHLIRESLKFNNNKFLVLDETDRMLDLGFGIQIDEILKYLPKNKQTMMFSATLSKSIEKLSEKYLTDPIRITVGSTNLPIDKIKQDIINVSSDEEKYEKLINYLNNDPDFTIIFVKTKLGVEKLSKKLDQIGFAVNYLHGDLHQSKRSRIIKSFQLKKYNILVATDVAARGLDISHIKHVVNYDLPENPEDYIHRIGRTARAGATGNAISFVNSSDRRKLYEINKLINPKEAEMLKNQFGNLSKTQNRRQKSNNKFDFKKDVRSYRNRDSENRTYNNDDKPRNRAESRNQRNRTSDNRTYNNDDKPHNRSESKNQRNRTSDNRFTEKDFIFRKKSNDNVDAKSNRFDRNKSQVLGIRKRINEDGSYLLSDSKNESNSRNETRHYYKSDDQNRNDRSNSRQKQNYRKKQS